MSSSRLSDSILARGTMMSCTVTSPRSNRFTRIEMCFFGSTLEYSSKMVRISSGDISPASSPRRMRAMASSGLRIAFVDAESTATKGAETRASTRIGHATRRAMPSALCCPRRFGTSSPTTMETYVMATTMPTVATMFAVFGASVKVACSHPDTGAARKASPTMPFRMPMDVMPIWMVDRNRVGSRASARAEAASRSPCFARASSRGLRAVNSATSDMANRPFRTIRLARSRISMEGSVQLRPRRTSRTKRLPT